MTITHTPLGEFMTCPLFDIKKIALMVFTVCLAL